MFAILVVAFLCWHELKILISVQTNMTETQLNFLDLKFKFNTVPYVNEVYKPVIQYYITIELLILWSMKPMTLIVSCL